MAIDGFEWDVPAAEQNGAAFGFHGAHDPQGAAFPKARVVTISGCGSHAVVGAAIGGTAGKGTGSRCWPNRDESGNDHPRITLFGGRLPAQLPRNAITLCDGDPQPSAAIPAHGRWAIGTPTSDTGNHAPRGRRGRTYNHRPSAVERPDEATLTENF